MKTIHLLFIALATLSLSVALAETPPAETATERPIKTLPAGSPHDGFFLRGTGAFIIRNGVTTKMEHEVVLPNGLRVMPDGKVTLTTGSASMLREDHLLTLQGAFEPFVNPARAAASISTAAGANAARREVGISDRDGITVSGTDVFITRNGITDKLTADRKLPNGVIAKPDGTIVKSDGQRITLRVDQILDLNGVLRDAPVRPSPPGPSPSSSTTQGN